MTLFTSLKHRPFALLWSGQAVSQLGDALYRIVLSWWVLEKTGSATVMGTVLVFSFTPMILFLLLGGVAVDRYPRVKVMILSDLLRGLVILVISLLALSQRLEIWQIYLASLLFGFVSAFFQPAYTALVPEITPGAVLPSANSLTSLSQQFANVVGPALGAAIVGLGGTGLGFGLDAFSFFFSAVCLWALSRQVQLAPPNLSEANLLREARAGLSVVLGNPWLWITIVVAAALNVTVSGPYSVALPFLVKDYLKLDVAALGWIYSVTSAGSVLGAVWLGQSRQVRRRGLVVYGAWLGLGLTRLVFGLPLGLAAIYPAAFLGGVALSISGLVWTYTLQQIVPGHLLGRVSSIDYIGSFVLIPVGYAVAGVLADQVGAPLLFQAGGLATIGLCLAALFHPAIRGMD